jgi:GPH family glycoside/pentoside/hexuronide:cation symporter
MIKASTRISYGAGGGVYAVKEAAYTVFILLYYTQVLGLSGTITGVVIAISLLWDGISDPLIGSWSDRVRSRYGRRHPFMVYSTVPLAIGFIGLFSPPGQFMESPLLLAGWLLFWSLWVRTFVTAFSIPHLALSAELSSDYNERSQLMALRLGFLFLTVLLLPAVGLLFIFGEEQGVDGRFVATNYPWYGLLSAAVATTFSFISVMGTRLNTSQPDATGERYALPGLKSYLDDIVATFRNLVFRRMIAYEIASAVSWGGAATLNILILTYVFELDAEQVALVLAAPSLIAVTLVWTLLKPLTQRWQKPQLLRLSLWGLLLNGLWLLPLKLADLLPANGSQLTLGLIALHGVLMMFFFFLRATSAMSIVADITDQHELEQGDRKEGGFFSVMTLILKVSTLVGPLYSGIVLDVIGLSQQDLPGEVAQPVLSGLMYATLLIVIPTLALALRFAYRIEFSKEQIEDIQGTLRDRQAST